jgi:hypothetical protein
LVGGEWIGLHALILASVSHKALVVASLTHMLKPLLLVVLLGAVSTLGSKIKRGLKKRIKSIQKQA